MPRGTLPVCSLFVLAHSDLLEGFSVALRAQTCVLTFPGQPSPSPPNRADGAASRLAADHMGAGD